MKKLYFTILLISGLFAQNSVLKQFSDQFADIAEKANPAFLRETLGSQHSHSQSQSSI